jgi:hypothetical protein
MDYIEAQPQMGYVTGLNSNQVLKRLAADVVEQAQRLYRYRCAQTDSPVKVTRFHSVWYRAGTWSRHRRVVIKVEVSGQGLNMRFVVSNLDQAPAQRLYQQVYCARGQAENYIKDHKTYLKSDRTSCHRFAANQFRLFLHSAAYVLYEALRREVLAGTEYVRATIETLRLKLIKLGACVRELKTRVKVAFASSCPSQPVLRSSFALLALVRSG